jgi:hypothetical protein
LPSLVIGQNYAYDDEGPLVIDDEDRPAWLLDGRRDRHHRKFDDGGADVANETEVS